MVYNHATTQNIGYFSELTGMPEVVCHAILDCEAQEVDNPTNPLNIEYYGSARPAQIGHEGRFAVYNSNLDGIRDAYGVLHLPYYNDLRAVWHSNDALKIARAWELSPWSAGHYGATSTAEGSVVMRTAELMKIQPYVITVTKKYSKPYPTFHTIPHTSLYGYDPNHPGAPVMVATWDKASPAHYNQEVSISWPKHVPQPVPHGGPFLHVFDGTYHGLYIVKAQVET